MSPAGCKSRPVLALTILGVQPLRGYNLSSCLPYFAFVDVRAHTHALEELHVHLPRLNYLLPAPVDIVPNPHAVVEAAHASSSCVDFCSITSMILVTSSSFGNLLFATLLRPGRNAPMKTSNSSFDPSHASNPGDLTKAAARTLVHRPSSSSLTCRSRLGLSMALLRPMAHILAATRATAVALLPLLRAPTVAFLTVALPFAAICIRCGFLCGALLLLSLSLFLRT